MTDPNNRIQAVVTFSGIITKEQDGTTLTVPFLSEPDRIDGHPTWFGVYFRLNNGEVSHIEDYDTPEEARAEARRRARALYVPFFDRIIL